MMNCIKEIGDFFSCYQKAAWEKDINMMLGLYDEDVITFDTWSKGFSFGLKEWSALITDWLTSLKDEKVMVEFEMIDIHESESIAFASALIRYKAISPGNIILRSMKNRISAGFVKTNGVWKVKHQHISAPIDGNLRAILDI